MIMLTSPSCSRRPLLSFFPALLSFYFGGGGFLFGFRGSFLYSGAEEEVNMKAGAGSGIMQHVHCASAFAAELIPYIMTRPISPQMSIDWFMIISRYRI